MIQGKIPFWDTFFNKKKKRGQVCSVENTFCRRRQKVPAEDIFLSLRMVTRKKKRCPAPIMKLFFGSLIAK